MDRDCQRYTNFAPNPRQIKILGLHWLARNVFVFRKILFEITVYYFSEILSRAHSITEALDETSKGTKFFKVRQKGGFRGLKLYCRTFKTDISEFSITYLPNKAITGKANCIGNVQLCWIFWQFYTLDGVLARRTNEPNFKLQKKHEKIVKLFWPDFLSMKN